ncbi:MAG: hypothetical protein A2177_06925 [Spirochaetes bacterium RBG_13_68_11]|nr:MAG: hypothetical protein A2177_06925 [Spirochaetes bacterium RBG_13_68_11]
MAAAHGLLQKARAYLDAQRRLVLVRPGDDGKSTLQIREADRTRILEEIEREVSGSRTPVTPELLSFTPRRRGSALPLAVNLAAVAVMAAGIYGAFWLSQQREQAAAAAPATLTTAEGKLLEALKKESGEQLAGKDRQIADIRGKLAGLDQERDRLRAESDSRVSAKERELADEMARTLETERQKLLATGLSEAAVAKRLADRETAIRASADKELSAFRQQAETDRADQEQAVEQLRTEYQQSLAQTQADRTRIQEEAARKQANLEAGYRQKQLALEQDKAAAVAELDSLRRAQEKESLVLDQFVSFYREVKDEIAAGRPEAATAVLARFRSYLDDASVAVLPAISRRRPVELFLIGSLEEIARARSTAAAESTATQSIVASASLVAAVAGLVQDGDAAFADKDYARAREVYLAALAKIPAVQTGTERLADIERIYAEQDRRAMNALFAEGNAAYLAGDNERAVDRYRRGLEALAADRGIADTLVAQLAEIGAIRQRAAAAAAAPAAATGSRDTAADEAARAALLEEIARLRAEGGAANAERDTAVAERDRAAFTLAAERDRRTGSLAGLAALRNRAARPAAENAGTRESMLSLLETKVLVQKVLLSDAVLAEYPDLADRLDGYLEALVAESRGEAELDTLRDLDAVLGGLAAGKGAEVSDAFIARRAANGQQDLLLGILDKLKSLLE